MKKRMLCLAAALCLMLSLVVPACAASGSGISVAASLSADGSTVTAVVSSLTKDTLYAGQFTLVYDPAVLTYKDTQIHSPYNSFFPKADDSVSGEVHFAALSDDGVAFAADDTVMTVTFRVVPGAKGPASVSLRDIILTGASKTPVRYDGSSVSVALSAPSADGTAAYLKGSVMLLIGSGSAVARGALAQIDPDDAAVAPYISADRTMVPLRFVSEKFGAAVQWDASSRTVTITLGGTVVVMTIGQTSYTVNGAEKQLDAAPEISHDRTMVPLRFVAEALGMDVNWYGASRIAVVSDASLSWSAAGTAESAAVAQALAMLTA